MADSSTLCFSSSFHAFSPVVLAPSPPRKLAFSSFSSSYSYSPSAASSHLARNLFLRSVRPRAKGSDDGDGSLGDDPYGPYPWESSAAFSEGPSIQWVPEGRITLFTSEGLIQIGGSLIPQQFPNIKKRWGKPQVSQKQRFCESNYMDPKQQLCLGALFNIAATNGHDMGRRLCFFGFCRSIEMLSDVVQDTVVEHGGEVVAAEKVSSEGLQEKLAMTVAVPLLWGVPPASDTLRVAVRSGGGIVEKVYWQWNFL